MYLLDTNIISYLMRSPSPALKDKIFSIPPVEMAVSSITVLEMQFGARRKNWSEKLINRMWEFLAPFTIVDFDISDAIVAGDIRAYLSHCGQTIGSYDVLIAAQGVSRNMTVVTHNIREFERVPGIQLEDWVF